MQKFHSMIGWVAVGHGHGARGGMHQGEGPGHTFLQTFSNRYLAVERERFKKNI
jgi:hypothetical protein